MMLADVGVMAKLATGTRVTVTLDVPGTPSIVAVIVTAPGPRPVTTPLRSTTATAGLLVRQVTARPVTSWVPANAFAVRETVAPTTIEVSAGVTATRLTGTAVTVIAANPVFPPLRA